MMSMTSSAEHAAIELSSVSTGPGAALAAPSIRCVLPAGPASNERSPRQVISLLEMTGAGVGVSGHQGHAGLPGWGVVVRVPVFEAGLPLAVWAGA